MEFRELDLDNIRIEQNEDILFTTIGKYKLFIKYKDKGGLDALNLFMHYMFTARLQHTNAIKANDQYVRNALGFGIVKLKRAKALLYKFKLIEYKQERNLDGTMKEQYILLKMSGDTNIVPAVQLTAPPVDRPTGDEKQMLKQESKCFNKKYKDIVDLWKSKEKLASHSEKAIKRNIKKRHFDIVEECGVEEVKKAIDNYYTVFSESDYWWSHRFTLWRFLEKIDTFLDENDPLNNYKIKSVKPESKSVNERMREAGL